ncbi:DUF6879 family protein [Saccharopolyspora mangrovi]|uniref:DUF6879 domain-containing protein n=1 Tax=Saccharopolyspora mangrovi TaxID=3082379 RepID=A0ABU6AJ11_9PSEU|nr:DUF6879 family protein [Saccharopolyspora sp. S2-29]MEB3371532.1 hypothetical protein [Saccharopolyspora sp. S2-29]
MILSGDEFGRLFDEYRRSAWRFECQPTYTIPREQDGIRRWRAGEPKPEDHNIRWHETVQEIVASGRRIGRARVVRRPLTEYLRYQLDWGIPGNIEAGEDIRILDLTELELELPEQDFWFFDDAIVVHLNFNPDGTLINLEQQETSDLERYLKWRDVAMAHAVPLSEWNART